MSDPRVPGPELLADLRAAAAAGADWIHVRAPTATARDLFELVRAVAAACRPLGARIAVNDRVDVALAVGADAVQLGARGLPIAATRAIAPSLRVGRSVHSVEEACEAAAAGADWLFFGHVFPTASHPDEPPRGVTELQRAVRAVPTPVVAIGGITAPNVAAVLATGAAGVAVISAIVGKPDAGRATRAIRGELDAIRLRDMSIDPRPGSV